jgi:hypothetical protein
MQHPQGVRGAAGGRAIYMRPHMLRLPKEHNALGAAQHPATRTTAQQHSYLRAWGSRMQSLDAVAACVGVTQSVQGGNGSRKGRVRSRLRSSANAAPGRLVGWACERTHSADTLLDSVRASSWPTSERHTHAASTDHALRFCAPTHATLHRESGFSGGVKKRTWLWVTVHSTHTPARVF